MADGSNTDQSYWAIEGQRPWNLKEKGRLKSDAAKDLHGVQLFKRRGLLALDTSKTCSIAHTHIESPKDSSWRQKGHCYHRRPFCGQEQQCSISQSNRSQRNNDKPADRIVSAPGRRAAELTGPLLQADCCLQFFLGSRKRSQSFLSSIRLSCSNVDNQCPN